MVHRPTVGPLILEYLVQVLALSKAEHKLYQATQLINTLNALDKMCQRQMTETHSIALITADEVSIAKIRLIAAVPPQLHLPMRIICPNEPSLRMKRRCFVFPSTFCSKNLVHN